MVENKNKLNKIATIVLLVVLVIILFLVVRKTASNNQLPEKGIVKIGFIGDFDNDGVGIESKTSLAAVKIAVEDINKIADKKYELVSYNTNQNIKEDVANAFNSASKDNAYAVITQIRNTVNLPGLETLPTIRVGGIGNESKKIDHRFYWGVSLFFYLSDYIDQNIALVKSRYSIKDAAFITKNEDISESFIKGRESMNDITISKYLYDNSKNMDIFNDINQKNPDIIILFLSTQNSIQLLKAAKENGMEDKLFLAFLPTTNNLLTEDANLPKRLLIASPPANVLGSLKQPSDSFEKFANKFTSITGNSVTNLELNSYDAVTLIAYAVSKADITNTPETIKEDREKIMKELWAVQDFKSLRGSLNPDGKSGYIKRDYVSTYYIENGRFKSAKGKII